MIRGQIHPQQCNYNVFNFFFFIKITLFKNFTSRQIIIFNISRFYYHFKYFLAFFLKKVQFIKIKYTLVFKNTPVKIILTLFL